MEFEAETGYTSLTVQQIFVDDIGVFRCVADNRYGKCETSANLNVNGREGSEGGLIIKLLTVVLFDFFSERWIRNNKRNGII